VIFLTKDKVSNGDIDTNKADLAAAPVEDATGKDMVSPGESTETATGAAGDENYKELKELLEKKESEAAEYLDTLKRVQAEMENYKKRMLKEQAQILEYAAQTVILELLPVIDNLERALETAKAEGEAGKLREGVELIYTQLTGILKKECVEVINPVGEQFDPLKHEAVMQVEADGHEENAVVEVLQKGYDLKGRLLRPAMVKVAK